MLGLELEAVGDGAEQHLGDLDPVLFGWWGVAFVRRARVCLRKCVHHSEADIQINNIMENSLPTQKQTCLRTRSKGEAMSVSRSVRPLKGMGRSLMPIGTCSRRPTGT